MINVLVIDDHPVFIDGLKSVFSNKEDRIKISDGANSAKEALPILKNSKPDVVLLDLVMPEVSGVEFCRTIKEKFPNIKVIVLTGELNPVLLFSAWMHKADAILTKYCRKEEIQNTIFSVLNGQRVIGTDVPEFRNQFPDSGFERPNLTNRELQILRLLADGLSRKEVANRLDSNLNAVRFHCKNIFRKMNKNKLIAVIEEAKKHKII